MEKFPQEFLLTPDSFKKEFAILASKYDLEQFVFIVLPKEGDVWWANHSRLISKYLFNKLVEMCDHLQPDLDKLEEGVEEVNTTDVE